MHAALISLVLMSGACGDVPPEELLPLSHPCEVTVSVPPLRPPHGCPACGNSVVPPLYQGCPYYAPAEIHTTPAWQTGYHPAWYYYCRMLFHPADYTQPYPYRERFNYPWNDPRCPCAIPPIGY